MTDLDKLRKKAVKDIVPHLPALPRADVVELLAREEQELNPRESLIKALAEDLHRRDAEDTTGGGGDGEAGVDAAPAEPPAWQSPDYAGPLDGVQAAWRNAHLRERFGDYVTKPVEVEATK